MSNLIIRGVISVYTGHFRGENMFGTPKYRFFQINSNFFFWLVSLTTLSLLRVEKCIAINLCSTNMNVIYSQQTINTFLENRLKPKNV